MRVLMLSTDTSILEEGTEARRRMEEYAGIFEELSIIVASQRKANVRLPRQEARNDNSLKFGNLFIYPTNSGNKFFALWEAYKIGKKILMDNKVMDPSLRWDDKRGGDWAITAQDPFEFGLVGYLLKRKFGAPLQLQVHTDFLSPYFWHESLKNKIRAMIAKWLLPKADGIRVVSERIRKSLVASGYTLAPIEVLPIFVDAEKIKNAPIKTDLHKKYPQFDFIILMASRLSPEKNIQLAITAFEEVLKYNSNATKSYANTTKKINPGLVIVGEGLEKEKLESVIARSEATRQSNNIILENWTEDLASYYKTADLFLLTSLYEGYARTVIEAMAAGLPAVMTDVGVAGDAVKDGENAYVVDVGDKRGLAERVAKLIEHTRIRQEFAVKGLEVVEKMPTKEEYLKKYKEAIEIL